MYAAKDDQLLKIFQIYIEGQNGRMAGWISFFSHVGGLFSIWISNQNVTVTSIQIAKHTRPFPDKKIFIFTFPSNIELDVKINKTNIRENPLLPA